MFNSTSIVLVTGANGHVASHIVDQLLALTDGPVVRGTVRSQTTVELLSSHYKGRVSEGRLEIICVPDMLADGAFDEAVKGCTHIAHVASPLVIGGVTNVASELLNPAINGTLGILKAASQSPTVKAVVITSSFGSVFDPSAGWRPGYTYSSVDWNPSRFEAISDPDLDLSVYPETWRPYVTYCASKVLAEKAAWEYRQIKPPNYSLSTILPTYIGGPSVLPLTSGAKSLSFSQALIWKAATDSSELPSMDFPGWVHVSDVARAHIAALEREVDGKRYLVSEGNYSYEKIADVVRAHFPSLTPSRETQRVKTWSTNAYEVVVDLELDSYIPFARTVVETVAQVLGAEMALRG